MEDEIEECIRKKIQWSQLPATVKKVTFIMLLFYVIHPNDDVYLWYLMRYQISVD